MSIFTNALYKIAILFMSMLKTTWLFKLALKKFGTKNEVVRVGGRADKTFKNSPKFKKSPNDKFKNLTHIKATKKPTFLISSAKKAFSLLRQAFIKAPIFCPVNAECHIRIKTDASD